MEFISTIRETETSELDVRLAKKGDKEAFGRLIEEYKVSLYRVALTMLTEKQDIEDAIQNTIIKAYEGIIYLRKNEFFKTWLIKILINECRSILRKYKRIVPMEQVNVNIGVRDDYSNIEIQQAVNLLDEDLRIVITLFYFEDN
ncbi:sigma-70 family RNA polymerase sigma factor [Clostridium sp. C8-1-8]|uniref:sigma-70 family RNA polymerase sigma factor n=1 Tax=Clostridium sp. C8-1-8 TaxID=2698831 RepID=UPI00136E4224|nr:sigma-70 family RNA polymerase sigma factor [Clostridium sp. C8-1-8]